MTKEKFEEIYQNIRNGEYSGIDAGEIDEDLYLIISSSSDLESFKVSINFEYDDLFGADRFYSDIYDDEVVYCDCGKLHHIEDAIYLEKGVYCESCLDPNDYIYDALNDNEKALKESYIGTDNLKEYGLKKAWAGTISYFYNGFDTKEGVQKKHNKNDCDFVWLITDNNPFSCECELWIENNMNNTKKAEILINCMTQGSSAGVEYTSNECYIPTANIKDLGVLHKIVDLAKCIFFYTVESGQLEKYQVYKNFINYTTTAAPRTNDALINNIKILTDIKNKTNKLYIEI